MKKDLNIWLRRGGYPLVLLLIIVVFWACGFEWYTDRENIIYKQSAVEAGDVAEFELRFKAYVNQDYSDKLILAVQVPKVWNPRVKGNIEVTYEVTNAEAGVTKYMDLIPTGTSPAKQPGVSWEEHLLNRFSDQDPNILDDMQWVTFVSKEKHSMSGNATWDFVAKFKIKTGPQNLRAKIGFCVYHEEDGGGDIGQNESNVWNHYIVDWGDCFEVVEGEGEVIDFCDLHFNQQTPGQATQNDILTLRFLGDIADNDLLGIEDLYINMTAITTSGEKYEMLVQTDDTKLIKESELGLTFSKTFWPEGYFNLEAGEKLSTIEYYFTNKDGSKYVSLYDDLHKNEPEENPTWTEKPVTPFVFIFQE